ncbi:3'-5' exonuclease domain-containing protein [Hirsutella rhossiliensis]|uniref:3'-5' exonuclease domain-containing protein n=1 Tax=Hirsutella rhossiliensis TaxID=111463 RepID=A0A9P8SKT7_9HYPO|nr:3'-5' exonuclease domain-containing protein [Hirsutella rhossiliensis]KAH0965120.1 3'-5' exonuclease domain-containing protein [Hirsutella rhossiliensis]
MRWHPSMGIRFSPSPERAPLYPRLDVCRFLHVPTTDGHSSSEPGGLDRDVYHVRMANEGCFGLRAALGNEVAASLVHEASNAELDDAGIAKGTESAMYMLESSKENEPESLDPASPPQTPMNFVMSTELFKAAKAAEAGTPASFWSHTLYEHINAAGDTEKVKVHYCTSKHATELVCQKHFLGQEILGFDLEWSIYANRNSGPRENVSLIQLASPSRIGLFQVAMFAKDDFVAPTFRKIMEDPNVRKAGVNIRGDCTRLKNHLGIAVQGVFELSHLYKQVKYSAAGTPRLINKSVVAMSIQAQEHLGLPLFKGNSVRTSNWQQPLNTSQITYAAADAYAGLQLYHVLDAKRKELKPCPPRPHHAELGLPIPRSTPAKTPKPVTARPRKPRAPKPQIPIPVIRDARIVEAERMAQEFRASSQTPVASPLPVLRAYYIWHVNEDLDPISIAKLLRDPPLQTGTVITYLLNAVVELKLPYSRIRLKREVLSFLHQTSLNGKYRSLAKDCENVEPQIATA